jgi:hypothetical protein
MIKAHTRLCSKCRENIVQKEQVKHKNDAANVAATIKIDKK